MDLDEMTDEELDEARRAVLREQERRHRLHEGLEAIGSAICDYADAARIEPPEGDRAGIGRDAVEAITGQTIEVPDNGEPDEITEE